MKTFLLLALVCLTSAALTNVTIANGISFLGTEGFSNVTGGVAFTSIPFAQPPIGSLRFMPPQPLGADYYNKVYNSSTFVSCVQPTGLGQEDCLYLAVYLPPNTTTSSNFPVRQFIYGGSYTSGAYGTHNGAYLAAATNSIIVVANYRVGIAGFFVSSGTVAGGGLGNYGLLDQQAAIKWTHTNIARFGGDPNNITIFGESAGGSSVSLQMLISSTWPYFNRAIIESGGPWAFRTFDEQVTLADTALNTSQALLLQPLCPTSKLNSMTCLQSLPIQYVAVFPAVPLGQPIVDGTYLTGQPLDLYAAGKFKPDTPIMIGINADEGPILAVASYAPSVVNQTNAVVGAGVQYSYNLTPEEWSNISSVYNFPSFWQSDPTYGAQFRIYAEFVGDFFIKCGNLALAEYAALNGATVYTYYFSYVNPNDPTYAAYGTYHTAELQYVFNYPNTVDPNAAGLNKIFVSHWANFSATGNPNSAGNAQWDAFTTATNNTFLIPGTSVSQGPLPRIPRCETVIAILRDSTTSSPVTVSGSTSAGTTSSNHNASSTTTVPTTANATVTASTVTATNSTGPGSLVGPTLLVSLLALIYAI